MDMKLNWGEVGTVTLSGLLIVFVVLIILIAIVWAYGQIFHTINKRKANKQNGAGGKGENVANGDSVESVANVESVDNVANVESVENGIQGSIIAAISAAVAAFTGGKGVVTGIKRSKNTANGKRRNTEWGQAGTLAAMRNLHRIGR